MVYNCCYVAMILLLGEEKEGKTETKRGRIATNAHVVPKEHMKG